MDNSAFYTTLKSSLNNSNGNERKIWASYIIENNIDIKYLSNLLTTDKKTATRFSWLLSDIGETNPNRLHSELPYLFELSDRINLFNFKLAFATYWQICGIPIINESKAIELLFDWIQSPDINVTMKSRSILALYQLTLKYPELKDELKLCLEDQKDRYSKDFYKKVNKILIKLEV